MKTNYQPPITTLAEVRKLWRYLGAASQCNLLREFDVEPSDISGYRWRQVEKIWRHGCDRLDRRSCQLRICQFVEEVADTVRGNV